MKPSKLLDLLGKPFPLLSIHSNTEQLPNGLAAAMAPAIVDWQGSQLTGNDDDFFLVRNVNVGSNPVEGNIVLATLKIPLNGIIGAQWVLVMMRKLGKDTLAGHGQLRMVFNPENCPVILNDAGNPRQPEPYVKDLVFSFEAWRPAGISFNPLAGLDPSTYALTMRCYAGSQRFLEDGVLSHSWVAYPLDLNDHPETYPSLLYTALVTGDSLARHTINHLLDNPRVHTELNQSDYPFIDPRQLNEFQQLLAQDLVPKDPIADLMDGNISYHLLQRSCITMGLNVIDNGLHRLHRLHPELGEYQSLRVGAREIPSWINQLAHSNRRSTLMKLPGAMHWIMMNQSVLPDRSYVVLKDGGLLALNDRGEVMSQHFQLGGETPYGRISESLMQ